jgi:tetratricopeptide (TPR) repeat protein
LSLVGLSLCLAASVLMASEPVNEKSLLLRPPSQDELNRREALKLFSQASLLQLDHRYLDAIKLLEDARRLDPDAAAIHRHVAALYLIMDHVEEGMASYRKALELEPADGETWYEFGRQLRQQNQPRPAIEAMDRGAKSASLATRPDVLFALLSDLADLHEELKEPAKAAAALERAAGLLDKPEALIEQGVIDPDFVQTRLADLLERIGRDAAQGEQHARAIAAFQKAQKIDPTRKDHLNFNLSDIYFAQKDWSRSLECINLYLQSQPTGLEAYERKLALLRKLSVKNSEILRQLLEHANADPNNTPLRLLYARELASSGRHSDAEKEYLEQARKSPTPEVYRGLFALYAAEGRPGSERMLKEFNDCLTKADKHEDHPQELAAAERAAGQGRAMLAVLRDDPMLVKAVLESAGPKIGGDELASQTRLFLAVLADRTRQLDLAEQLYRSCLKDLNRFDNRRDEQEVYSGLLRILWRARKYDDIVKVCQQGLKQSRFTNRVVFHTDLARALDQLGKSEEALKQANQAVEAAGARENLYARRIRILILADMERYDQAIAECQAMLKEFTEKEDIRDIRYALSSVYSLQHDYARAEEQLQILLETDPTDAVVRNDLGYTWADQGKNLDEAEKLIRAALELDHKQRTSDVKDGNEDNAAYIDSLAWVLFRKGKVREALKELEKASAMPEGADDPVVWDHLGDVCYRLEDKARARSAWQKAIEMYDAGRRRKTDDRYKEVQQKLKLLEPTDRP